MRNFISPIILFIGILGNGVSFTQGWELSTTIKGSNIEPVFSVIDNQNDLIVLSYFTDTIYNPYFTKSYGARDLFLFKVAKTGEILWYNRIGCEGPDIHGGLAIDNQNNIYVAGTFNNYNCRFTPDDSLINKGSGDIFLAMYTSAGSFSWAKSIGSASTLESALDLKFNGNNRLIMSGFFRDSLIIGSSAINKDTLTGNSYNTNFIATFDMNAELIWAKRYLGTNNLTRFWKVESGPNGYYFGGFLQGDLYLDIDTITSYTVNNYDAFLYKTDINGNGLWARGIYGQNTENFRAISKDEYDNIYVLGNYNSTNIYVDSTESQTILLSGNSGGYDTYIGKYNRSGVLQWFIRKGSSAKDIYLNFVVRNNLIYATGYFANEIIFNIDTLRTDDPLNEDAFLAAFNEIGDPIAGVSIEGTGNYNDAGTVVNMGTASKAYVAGYYKSQQIQIGSQIYTSDNVNKSDLFFAIYQHPFTAVITDERSVSCYGLSDGMLKVTPYFGKPPYTYQWSHDPGLHDPVAEDLPAGPYSVTITDANSNVAHVSTNVPQPQPLVITETVTDVSCYNGNDGAISVVVTGGTVSGLYDYYWTSLDGSGIEPLDQNQSGLTKGTYTLEVKDDNLCSETEDYLVSQPGKIIYAGSVVTDIVTPPGFNGSIDLTVSGGNAPYDYAWTGPGVFSASTEDIANLDTAGLYVINITDDKDCVSDTSFAVNDNFTMVAQVTDKTDVLCYGDDNGTATVTVYNGQAPFTYQWSDGVNTTLATRTGMSPDYYTVLVTGADMRTAQAFVQINGPAAALSLTLAKQDLRCYQDNSGVIDLIVYNGTLPYSFLWSNGYTGEDLVNVASDLYTVTVTDANGCMAMGNETVGEPPPIQLNIDVSGEILCFGDLTVTATANASGGTGNFSYLWNDPGAQITKTAYELGAGNYTVKVTDQNGCYVTDATLITGPDSISIQFDPTLPSCPGDADGTILPTVSGGTPGYDYVWSNDVFQRINTNIPAGLYTLTVTDNNNCSVDADFRLNDPDSVKILSAETTDLSCSGHPDGSITINAGGGTGMLQYSIDGGNNYIGDASFTSLAEGSYTLRVKDGNNCESEDVLATLAKSPACGMIIYDAFSPNNDSYNDVWNIGNIDNYPSCSVKIYNTWGTMVFSSDGYGTPWDGTYEGKELPAGTYYYMIDPGDGSDVLTGPVSIVK